MKDELKERLEDHAILILDSLEDGESNPLTEDQRKQLTDELRTTMNAVSESDKQETEYIVEARKQKLTIGRVALELSKVIVPAAISGGVILTCHKWGYMFEESGLRRISDVWRRMPNAKV